MLPILPNKWVYGEKVPFLESADIEFKEVKVFSGLFRDTSQGAKTGLTKYRETVIGFLNSGKGYLFMGIKNDGTIVGVENITSENIDMLKLWIDSSFNGLVYTDGKPLDPSKISIKLLIFPVENYASKVVIIKCINSGKLFNIMTQSGTIFHRLSASNYKIVSEPIYRKRDVKGIICSMQSQINKVISEKKRAIEDLKEKHKDAIKEIVQKERNSIRNYIDKISTSLYDKYKLENRKSYLFVDVIKYLLCIRTE